MLNIFETSRNSLIEDGLIKAKPTSMCKPGWGRKEAYLIFVTGPRARPMEKKYVM